MMGRLSNGLPCRTINTIDAKVCMMVVLTELYLFLLFPVTLISFEGVSLWGQTSSPWRMAWFSGVSHATIASPKPSSGHLGGRATPLVGRGNAGWLTSISGHSGPGQICSQWPPAEKTGKASLLNRPSCSPPPPSLSPDDQIGQGTELNWGQADETDSCILHCVWLLNARIRLRL